MKPIGKGYGFVRFESRKRIKWDSTISFFFGLEKRSEMPVNKGDTGCLGVSEKVEVRDEVPK